MPGYPAPTGRNGPVSPFLNAMLQAQGRALQGNNDLVASRQYQATVDQWGNTTAMSGPLDQIVTIGAAFQQPGVQAGTLLRGTGSATAAPAVVANVDTTEGSTSVTVTSTPSSVLTFSARTESGSDVLTTVGAPPSGLAAGQAISGAGIVAGSTISAVGSDSVTIDVVATATGVTTATVTVSPAAFEVGMTIGANETDPSLGLPEPAIWPGGGIHPSAAGATWIAAVTGSTLTLSQPAVATGTGIYCAACAWTQA